jgi:hypothetical protein
VRNDKGGLVNLYGRAAVKTCPRNVRHDFLSGPKGIFNQKVLTECESAYIVEGLFDALAMIAAGYPNTVAIFQAGGIRWNLVRSKNICFGFDPDQYGNRLWKKALDEGVEMGKQVYFLSKETFEGCDDLNQLWVTRKRINTKAIKYM